MPSKTQSILLGALAYAVLGLALAALSYSGGTSLQILGSCGLCLAALAGPALAVWHYTSTHRITLLAGQGAGMGAAAGALGALLSGAIQQLLVAVGAFPTPAELMERQRDQLLGQGMSAEEVDQAMAFGEQMASATGNPLIGIVIGIVIGALVGAIAGAIAASVFKKGADTSTV